MEKKTETNITLAVDQNLSPAVTHDICAAYLVEQLKENKKEQSAKIDISSIKDKKLLSVEEAAELFGVGRNKIREITDAKDCPFVIWIGSHRKIKREAFEEFLMNQKSI